MSVCIEVVYSQQGMYIRVALAFQTVTSHIKSLSLCLKNNQTRLQFQYRSTRPPLIVNTLVKTTEKCDWFIALQESK